MTIKTTLLLAFIFISSSTYAQTKTCDCGKDFEFLASAYIKDYSGMQDFSKKHPDYLQVVANFSRKAKSIKSIQRCDKLIGRLISYINNGHVFFGRTKENSLYGKETSKKLQLSLEPTLNFLDHKTVLIQIKTCELQYKNQLDSLISLNKTNLDSIEHLILDLRGNEGGGDATFDNIIPYLYTNPVLIHTAELWASENNIKMFYELLNNPEIPKETKLHIQNIINNAKNNPNTFVPLSKNKVDTLLMSSVSEFPKKVSVIIDRKCKSATEQFLLLAKQSKKTTIYGYTNSGGALDYANLNIVVTPSYYWYASVPTTRTTRLPEMPVDPDGIKPDILVDKKIKDIIQWVRLQHTGR